MYTEVGEGDETSSYLRLVGSTLGLSFLSPGISSPHQTSSQSSYLVGGKMYVMKVATSFTARSIHTADCGLMGDHQIPVRLLCCIISTFSAVSDDRSGCEHNWDMC